MQYIQIAPVLKKALAGVLITSSATTIITMTTMNNKKTDKIKINGVVYNGFYNTVFFQKGGKKLLEKALEKEGFFKIKFIYQDEDCIKISCFTANADVNSVFMIVN